MLAVIGEGRRLDAPQIAILRSGVGGGVQIKARKLKQASQYTYDHAEFGAEIEIARY